jgi:hypothetical protein
MAIEIIDDGGWRLAAAEELPQPSAGLIRGQGITKTSVLGASFATLKLEAPTGELEWIGIASFTGGTTPPTLNFRWVDANTRQVGASESGTTFYTLGFRIPLPNIPLVLPPIP